jgi:signal transduction histidine kinase/ligand-binding sensor domain-containing protein
MFRNKNAIFFIIGSFLLSGNYSSAQSISKAVVINSDKGLSQNSVYAICKDSKGFLWIGTGDGLNRYDGKEFVVFRNSLDPKHSLKGFYINYKMQEDNRHCLWFSTERNLVEYNQVTQTFTDIIPLNLPGSKSIVSIDTLQNTIWFITAGKCLYSYNYIAKSFQQYNFPLKGFEKNPFFASYGIDDSKGNIWITSSNGLFCFNKKNSSWQHFLKDKKINEACIDVYGKIWLINNDSVSSYDPQQSTFVNYKNNFSEFPSYISITSDDKGKIWIGTLDGNLYYSENNKKELDFAGNINIMIGSQNTLEMRCLYFDSSNLLWIGTEGGGVVKLDLNPVNFNNYPSEIHSPLNSLYIKSLLCDDDGKVWLGTFKKWIYIFDTKSQVAIKLPLPKTKNLGKNIGTVYSIKKDIQGIYWIAYNGILIAYNKKSNRFFFHSIPMNQNENYSQINHIEIENKHLFLSTVTGLYKATTSQKGRQVSFSKIYNEALSESLITEEGAIWASSLYSGLIKVLPQVKKPLQKLASENGIRCMVEDKEHKIIWAASQTGLLAYHLPSGKLKFYDERNGLLNGYLYGIIKNGNEIWVSSNKGIAKGMLIFKTDEVFPEISFKCYTKNDGLQSNEFNTGAYDQSPNGTIFFGGIHGLNWFEPSKMFTNHHRPSVAITGFKINDKSYEKTPAVEYLKDITTTYNNNTFTIKFIGLEFSNPESIYYRFKLEGLETTWTNDQNSREVRYANLPAGKYTFKVIAANSDNVLSDETTLAIYILPPFYQTWWFRVCMAVSILFIIVFITKKASQFKLKNRIRTLEKEKALEEERHRISKEMHDDLGAGLTQISLISEAAKRRNKEGRFPREELNDISETSKQLIENVSEIIWAMNPDFDTLSGMIAYLREQISKLLEYSGKKFHLQIPEDFVDINITNIRRKNILMLVKEAVNNAIKHSNASSVDITIVLKNNRFEIKITDDGNGFDVNKNSAGNGLKNYSYRSALLGGTAKVNSNEKGTEVYFDIPLIG